MIIVNLIFDCFMMASKLTAIKGKRFQSRINPKGKLIIVKVNFFFRVFLLSSYHVLASEIIIAWTLADYISNTQFGMALKKDSPYFTFIKRTIDA